MTSKTPAAGTPVATGVASGSLGTGTAVDEETTIMAVPDAPDPPERPDTAMAPAQQPAAAPSASVAAASPTAAPPAPVTRAATDVRTDHRGPSRRDPYRPIGIALAAILVALVGVAVLSSGGDTPAQIGAPPGAPASPGSDAAGDNDGDADEDEGDGNGNNGNGNGRGNGNGNGNGGDGGRGNDD